MKKFIMLYFFAYFYAVSFPAQHSDQQKHIKELLEKIPVDQLTHFFDQLVVYEATEDCFQHVILGEPLKGTVYFKAYMDGCKSKGIVCHQNNFYKKN